jgi:hypothetical protein
MDGRRSGEPVGNRLHSSLSSIEGRQIAARRSKPEQKHKEMLKMKVDPDELLKTKGLKIGVRGNPMSY